MSSKSLDSLAANGIINFDADSYINGTKPRYFGAPSGGTSLPGDIPLTGYGITPGENLHGEPAKDAFISHNEGEGSPLSMNTIATGGLVVALGLYAASKLKSFLGGKSEKAEGLRKHLDNARTTVASWINPNKETTQPQQTATAQTTTETPKAAAKTAPATEAVVKTEATTAANTTAKAEKGVKKLITQAKEFLAKHPKGTKITVAGLIGLLGLYGLYNFVGGNQNERSEGHA